MESPTSLPPPTTATPTTSTTTTTTTTTKFRPHNYTPLSGPEFPSVDLVSSYPFSKPIHETEPDPRWQDEWYKIVIETSPYNDLQGPIREPNILSAAQISAQKLKRIKAKLGIPNEGLLEGVDPAVERRKDGSAKPASPTKTAKNNKDKKRKKPPQENESHDSNSISHAGEVTMAQRGANAGGRRGGIFAFRQPQATKPAKKKQLKLTKEDQASLEVLDGQVPLSQWRNELSHIQMALNVDDETGVAVDDGFGLTELKVKHMVGGGKEKVEGKKKTDEQNNNNNNINNNYEPPQPYRRPEQIALDAFELPRYVHEAKVDSPNRLNEDEFVYDNVNNLDNKSWKNFGAGAEPNNGGAKPVLDPTAFIEKNIVQKFIDNGFKETTAENNENENGQELELEPELEQDNTPIQYKPLEVSVMEGPPAPAPPKHKAKTTSSNSNNSRTAKQNSSRQRLANFLQSKATYTESDSERDGDLADLKNIPVNDFDADPPAVERSEEMQNFMKKKLEDNLGAGFWNDEVASTLARGLDANTIYNPRGVMLNDPATQLSLQSQIAEEEEEEGVGEEGEQQEMGGNNNSSRANTAKSTSRSRPNTSASMVGSQLSPRSPLRVSSSSQSAKRPNSSPTKPSPGVKPIAKKKAKLQGVGLTETISIQEDAKQAAWLREQAKEALMLGRNDEGE